LINRVQILALAKEYRESGEYSKDVELAKQLRVARRRGYMTKNELTAVAASKWKGGRTRQLVSENTDEEVIEITRASFAASSERLRIGVLLCLCGVKWPMASVILHFAFEDEYPILDWRAMQAVGGVTGYNYERWIEYRNMCVATAKQETVSMRDLDRALWVQGGKKGAEDPDEQA
jgi:hypothetical protein